MDMDEDLDISACEGSGSMDEETRGVGEVVVEDIGTVPGARVALEVRTLRRLDK